MGVLADKDIFAIVVECYFSYFNANNIMESQLQV